MTNLQQLADDIAKVMELDAKRTKGRWEWSDREEDEDGYIYHPQCSTLGDTLVMLSDTYEDDHYDLDFIASAPLMADIIRRQRAVIRVLVGALEDADKVTPKELAKPEGFFTRWLSNPLKARITEALALAAPLLKEKNDE